MSNAASRRATCRSGRTSSSSASTGRRPRPAATRRTRRTRIRCSCRRRRLGGCPRLRHLAAAPASTAHLRVHRLRVAHEHPGARSRARPPLAVRQLIRAGHSARPGAEAASARTGISAWWRCRSTIRSRPASSLSRTCSTRRSGTCGLAPRRSSGHGRLPRHRHLRATAHGRCRVRGRGSDLGPPASRSGRWRCHTSTSPT